MPIAVHISSVPNKFEPDAWEILSQSLTERALMCGAIVACQGQLTEWRKPVRPLVVSFASSEIPESFKAALTQIQQAFPGALHLRPVTADCH